MLKHRVMSMAGSALLLEGCSNGHLLMVEHAAASTALGSSWLVRRPAPAWQCQLQIYGKGRA